MKRFFEHPNVSRWLSQFDDNSRPAARLLLTGLSFISFAEFEGALADKIAQICSSTSGRIAVFPVDPSENLTVNHQKRARRQLRQLEKLPSNPENIQQIESLKTIAAKVRTRASSAGRLSHILKMLERRFRRRIRLQPSDESMRAECIRHIVLVDDLIGSGNSMVKFWNAWASLSVKSWISFGYCKLWVVSYAAHTDGFSRVKNGIRGIVKERVLTAIQINRHHTLWDDHVLSLCDRYGRNTSKAGAARGYGGVMSPIVFQHGCPNNCPVILWDDNARKWQALFPNRAVPSEMYDCFSADSHDARVAEVLWVKGQSQLALGILESLKRNRRSGDLLDLGSILGLLRRGIQIKNLSRLLLVNEARISYLLQAAVDFRLVDENSHVTAFGIKLMENLKKRYLPRELGPKELAGKSSFYYPTQFKGAQ